MNNTHRRFHKFTIVLAVIVIAGFTTARAADVLMTASDALNTSSLNSAGKWSDLTAPSAANNYYSSNFFIRTPPSGNVAFPGNSLTLQPPSGQAAPMRSIIFKGGNNSVTTINNLTNAGGIINAGSGNVLAIFNGNAMYVISNSTIQADQGPFLIGYPLFGSADLTNTSGQGRTITYTNNNSAFTGRLVIDNNVTVVLTDPNGGPGNPAVLTPDQIILGTTSTLQANTNLTFNNANGGITLTANANISVLNTNNTLTIAEPITGGFTLSKRGGGILTLSDDNSGLSGGVSLFTATAGSQLNINSATALGSGTFTFGTGAVAPALLDNTSGSALTLTTANPQTWSSSFTFLGSSSLNMGSGSVTLSANVTATVSNNNLTVGAVLDDGLVRTLTKQGPGTLTIDGGATYLGNTTINEGVLSLTTIATLTSPVITVASNATLNVSGPGGLTLNSGQTLAGSGTVIGNAAVGAGPTAISPGTSAGTLTITGNLALTGGTTLNFELTPTPTVGSGVNDLIIVSGQLNLGGATTLNIIGATGSGVTYTLFQYDSFSGSLANATVPPGFTLTNNTASKTIQLISSHIPASLTWRGDGSLNAWDIGATANWIQSGTNQVFFNSDTVTFDNSGSNNVAVNLTTDLSPATTLVNASQNYTFTGSGIAFGSLTKSGSGTLVLDNTNTYAGATVINAGTLQLGDASGTAAGTTFGVAGSIGTGPVTNNGVLQFNRSGGNDLVIAANINASGTISNIGSAGVVILSGTVSGATVNQAGSGTLRLSGSNDYTGLTVVSSGTLSVQNTNALGATTAGTIVDGGTLYFDLNQPMVVSGETVTLRNNSTMARGGAQMLAFNGPVVVEVSGGMLQVDGGSTMTLSNEVSGAGALEKIQSGTLVLAASNTFSGGLTVSAGTLTLAHNNSVGNNSQILVTSTTGGPGLTGTRVTLSGGVSIPATKALVLPSSGPGTIRSTLFATGAGLTNTWAGPITLSGDLDPINAIGFGVDANSTFVISGNVTADSSFAGRVNMRGNNTGVGIITGTFALSAATSQFVVDDGSTWIVTSTGNTWATNFFAGNSTLRVGANNALPTTSALFLGNGAANRLDLGGFNQQLGGMDVTGINFTNSSISADSTLTYSSGGTSTFGGLLSDGTRKLNFTIAAGNLTLTNATTLNLTKSTVTVTSGAVLQLDFTGTNQVFGLVLNGVSQAPGVYSSTTSSPYLAGPGSLLVQPGPSGPATLTNLASGNSLNLSWPAGQGWRLQAQTNNLSTGLSNNWVYVTDGTVSSLNILMDPNQPTVFFRLRYP